MDDQQQAPQEAAQQPPQPPQQPPQQDLQQQLVDLRQLVSDQQQLLDDLRQRYQQGQHHDQPENTESDTAAANSAVQEALVRNFNVRFNNQLMQVDIDHYEHPATSGDPKKWMTRFETLTNEIGWNDARRACCLPSYLNKQAKKWYNHCNHNEWTDIRDAFITHFRALFGERTEYEALKFDHREPITKFIDAKEEKATAAGIPENQAIDHLILHANLPYDYAINLAAQSIATFADLKRAVNKMSIIREQRRDQRIFPSQSNTTRSYERPAFRHAPYGRPSLQPPQAQNAREIRPGGRPPICPECKRRGHERRHWLSDCFYRQQATSNTHTLSTASQRPANYGNRQHHQPRNVHTLELGGIADKSQPQQQQTPPN